MLTKQKSYGSQILMRKCFHLKRKERRSKRACQPLTHDSSEYGNPHKQLASYRKEIKEMTKIKPGHAAYRRLFNFLIMCQNSECGDPNPLDARDVTRVTLGKIQVCL